MFQQILGRQSIRQSLNHFLYVILEIFKPEVMHYCYIRKYCFLEKGKTGNFKAVGLRKYTRKMTQILLDVSP